MNKTAVITGASAGIGQALATQLARRGYHLALAARRVESLQALAASIKASHPELRVEVRALDVTDLDAVQATIAELAKTMGGLDLVVANAGIGESAPIGSGRFAHDVRLMQTNVLGAMATIDAAVAIFKKQKRGQVVAISSVAAFRGLPGAGAYSASKAAIATYTEALRAELHKSPIVVTTLFPGFIDTAINQRMKKRPFLITVEKGAEVMADLIERGVQTSTVPVMPWTVVGKLMKMMPLSALARQKPFDG